VGVSGSLFCLHHRRPHHAVQVQGSMGGWRFVILRYCSAHSPWRDPPLVRSPSAGLHIWRPTKQGCGLLAVPFRESAAGWANRPADAGSPGQGHPAAALARRIRTTAPSRRRVGSGRGGAQPQVSEMRRHTSPVSSARHSGLRPLGGNLWPRWKRARRGRQAGPREPVSAASGVCISGASA